MKINMADEETERSFDIRTFVSELPYDQWTLVPSLGWCPPARYKHAAVVVQEKLYVIGGNRNGRNLADVQVFDLRNLAWSSLELKGYQDTLEEAFPACAGHKLVVWKNNLLMVGGNVKNLSDSVEVRLIDLEKRSYNVVKTYGKVPKARTGQSVTLIGSRLVMFGGEDSSRQVLSDLYILDLETMTWDVLQAGASPAPRFDHTAAVYSDRYLLIFGGSSYTICFQDIYILDLQNMEWFQPKINDMVITPRAGHAGAVIDDCWYIVGGGDNEKGATETLLFNMSKLTWLVVKTVKEGEPLASEGISLCSTTMDGEKFLIVFGGYNGKYSNKVHILRPKARHSVQPRLFMSKAAAAAAASVTAAYASTTISDRRGIPSVDMRNVETIESKPPEEILACMTELSEQKRILESTAMEIRTGNSRLMNNLNEINNSYKELYLEFESVRRQLVAERGRSFKLELQIADMQKRLQLLSPIEQKLEEMRKQKSQANVSAVKPGRTGRTKISS